MHILVTGGAGYIGSHAVLRLLQDGHDVTVVDDLSRGRAGAIDALQAVRPFTFVRGDFGDASLLQPLLQRSPIDVVLHFAAFTYVGESVEKPLLYYRNNTAKTLALLDALRTAGVSRFIFSSTAATYGEPSPERIPIREDCPLVPINPYGASKMMVERVLRDVASASPGFAWAALRYFNVAGSDPHTRIGEDHDPETHLIPICLDAALGKRESLTIFGTDYPTPDGTCVRDYVDVNDLIDAHVTVMHALKPGEQRIYNVGIGRGYSVREVVEACQHVTGVRFAVKEGTRRAGDPPALYADPRKINTELGWKAANTDLNAIIETAWKWRQAHPNGYGT